jgi:hypothetical protein
MAVVLYSHDSNGSSLETEVAHRNRRKSCNAVMNIEQVRTLILGKKGSNLPAVIHKELKTLKAHKDRKVEKITKLIIRGGIGYDNMKAVMEGRENGTLPEENAGLPWGEWADEEGIHITHKGSDYVRMYPASGINIATGHKFVPEVSYLLDGKEVPKEEVMDLCQKSEFPDKKEEPLCFTIKLDNLVSLGGLA